MRERVEIRGEKEFRVTVLPQGARIKALPAPKASSNKTCGECGLVGKPGKRWRIRGGCVRCPSCVSLYVKSKKDQRDSALLRDGKAVPTSSGPVELGWNGVPSDRSLRRRSR